MAEADRSDEVLMALLAQGQQDALTDLVARYQNDIFRFCLHYVRDIERARELAQETFIRVYVARGRFDSSRRFKPWMLCIARNLCINDLKRKKMVLMESIEEFASASREDGGGFSPVAPDGPEEQLMIQERRDKLAEVLATLDDSSRELVIMRFFEKMAAREIADVVGITEGAVRTRLHRILKSLRTQYVECRNLF